MGTNRKRPDSSSINRRQLMGALTAAGVGGLAGCLGEDDEPEDLGERVPEIVLEYWSDTGAATEVMETSVPVIQQNLDELGLEVDAVPMELASQVESMHHDQHEDHLAFWFHTNVAPRLDPQEFVRKFAIDWAGNTGQDNSNNYANCEYSDIAFQQASAETEEQRRDLVHQAWSIFSEDLGAIPLFNKLELSVVNTDYMDPQGMGEAGLIPDSPNGFIQSDAVGDTDTLVGNIDPQIIQTRNWATSGNNAVLTLFGQLTHSPLMSYDEDYELVNILADSVESERDGTRVTVELADATFHNGDEITAEDVQFTFQQLHDNHDVYIHADQPPYESIDIVDDKTVEFNLENQFWSLISKEFTLWGIFHKESWVEGGAEEAPDEFQWDPPIGSGPFQVDAFNTGENLQLSPHDGHPVFSPDHGLFLQAHRDTTTAIEEYIAGELHFVQQITPGAVERAQENVDSTEVIPTQGFMPYLLYPHMSYAPMMFREFRQAVGMSLDRQLMNEQALLGEADERTDSLHVGPAHPYFPPDEMLTFYTDDPSGDIDGARDVLAEEGYQWDGNGRLHYPEDKDLEPLWPEGEVPEPENYPCIDADGNYVSPEDR